MGCHLPVRDGGPGRAGRCRQDLSQVPMAVPCTSQATDQGRTEHLERQQSGAGHAWGLVFQAPFPSFPQRSINQKAKWSKKHRGRSVKAKAQTNHSTRPRRPQPWLQPPSPPSATALLTETRAHHPQRQHPLGTPRAPSPGSALSPTPRRRWASLRFP